MSGPNPRRCVTLLAVNASDPIERPWNAPKKPMIACRFV
jgi:hypothetical protein